jgi:hypothetical protein
VTSVCTSFYRLVYVGLVLWCDLHQESVAYTLATKQVLCGTTVFCTSWWVIPCYNSTQKGAEARYQQSFTLGYRPGRKKTVTHWKHRRKMNRPTVRQDPRTPLGCDFYGC